jgi:AmmeMemoRadiSam system protein B
VETHDSIFDSVVSPIPELRPDLQIIPIEQEGRKLIYFHDSMNYLTDHFALDINVQPLLVLFDGSHSIEQIHQQLEGSIEKEELLNFVKLLDSHRVLNSDYYKKFSSRSEEKFEAQKVRYPALAGKSYPEDTDSATDYIRSILNDSPSADKQKQAGALYAPHIELSVGEKQYGEAFSKVADLQPKRVVILATSHYSSYYYHFYDGFPFIGSEKTYRINGRELEPDLEVIKALNKNSPANGFTTRDRAHRVEHSIEFHLLFASHIWQHDYSVVPILVGGFDELFYKSDGHLSTQIEQFSLSLKPYLDRDTFVLISGDLSHVGKKFGDREPASSMREQVEESDKQFLEHAITGAPGEILNHLSKDYDATRICGFSPLYTYLRMFPGKAGKLLNYFWWDEKETESAVSFGSILY